MQNIFGEGGGGENAYMVLVRKSGGRRLLVKPRYKW
jgi:hypothetical protein